LGIVYVINAYTSAGQHKEPQQQQQRGQQWGEQLEVNPPPPPLPTLEQVLALQVQILQTMQQTMINM
jgi:hypothetical protein